MDHAIGEMAQCMFNVFYLHLMHGKTKTTQQISIMQMIFRKALAKRDWSYLTCKDLVFS